MRQFASSGFRIWNLGWEAKLVYTGFGIFSLAALLVSMLFYEDLVGPRSGGVRAYYAGELPRQPPTDPGSVNPTRDGPAIEMPEDAAPRLTVAVTYRKLLEVTHFHLFTVPVFLLIIAHLFMLTGLGSRTKAFFIVTGWLSSAVHLAAPWLIRYATSALSPLYPISGGAMALSLGVMTVYPIAVMWGRR
jgi:hypothetical protein